jgi:hypothetical protein
MPQGADGAAGQGARQPGAAGQLGEDVPRGQAGPGQQAGRFGRQGGGAADPNSPEGAIEAFLAALASQDKETLAKSVSSKATGELAKAREGDIDSRGLSRMAEQYGSLKFVKVAPVTRGDERVVVLSSGGSDAKKGLKQATLRKEDGGWKVFKLQ